MSSAYPRVLVGFDGSEPSLDALALAGRLVDPNGGELLMAFVQERRAFRLPTHELPPAGVPTDGVPAGVRTRHVQRAASSAARGLTELAGEEHADLLVLGTHGGVNGRIRPGSTAMRLLTGAPCAVALAPAGLRERDRFRHVGVAYDGSDEAQAALRAAYALAERDGAAVTVYRAISRFGAGYAGSVPREVDGAIQRQRVDAQAQLDEAAEAAPAGVNPETVLVHDEPTRIAAACDGIVDLLVMGSRGYGPVHRVFLGSVSQATILEATQPVLLVPRASIPAAAGG